MRITARALAVVVLLAALAFCVVASADQIEITNHETEIAAVDTDNVSTAPIEVFNGGHPLVSHVDDAGLSVIVCHTDGRAVATAHVSATTEDDYLKEQTSTRKWVNACSGATLPPRRIPFIAGFVGE